jgi:protein phosphatase
VGVLVAGSAIGGFMLVHKTDDLSSANSSLSDDNAHLRTQLQTAQTQPSASPTPSQAPDATPEPSASPSPAVAGAATSPAPGAPASVTPMPQPKH